MIPRLTLYRKARCLHPLASRLHPASADLLGWRAIRRGRARPAGRAKGPGPGRLGPGPAETDVLTAAERPGPQP
jgi:hypothetical protein